MAKGHDQDASGTRGTTMARGRAPGGQARTIAPGDRTGRHLHFDRLALLLDAADIGKVAIGHWRNRDHVRRHLVQRLATAIRPASIAAALTRTWASIRACRSTPCPGAAIDMTSA